MKEYAMLCRRGELKKNREAIATIYHASRGKEFPVAFCNYNYDNDLHQDLEVSALVERVLNSYAKEGWRLVSTDGPYLYLERDV